MTKYSDYLNSISNSNNNQNKTNKNFEVTMQNDIMIIKIRQCVDDGSFNESLQSIKTNIESGIKKVVLDVSNNGGGNDGFCYQILDALGLDYLKGGFVFRYSWTTRRYRNTVAMTGKRVEEQVNNSKNENNIQLKVLVNENTGSAAFTPVCVVKYSNLGEIIGRPSVQRPNYYGNITYHSLKNSKLPVTCPVSQMQYSVDGKLVDNVLMPDKYVGVSENYWDYIQFN